MTDTFKERDWKGAYLELEGAHLELWRWARAFVSGLQDHAPAAACDMAFRFGVDRSDNLYSPYATVSAIRRVRLGLKTPPEFETCPSCGKIGDAL